MKLLKASIISMLVMCFVIMVCSLLNIEEYYTHPVFLLCIVLFVILQIACIVKYKFRVSFRSIGFYICHIGIILIACGGIIGFFCTQSARFNIPITTSTTYRQVSMNNGDVIDFGFSIAVSGFRVERYDDSGDDKQYVADMVIYDDNEENKYTLKVNSPVSYGGWKFYMMGYDADSYNAVSLYAKKNPGSLLLLFGFLAVDFGTVLMCFSALKSKKGAEKEDEV